MQSALAIRAVRKPASLEAGVVSTAELHRDFSGNLPASITCDLALILPVLYLLSGATSHLLAEVVKGWLRVQGSESPF